MLTHAPSALIPDDFTPVPSAAWLDALSIATVNHLGDGVEAVGVVVTTDGPLPDDLPLDRETLQRLGFEGQPSQKIVVPQQSGPVIVVVGSGADSDLSTSRLRDVAATFGRTASRFGHVALRLGDLGSLEFASAVQAVVEGLVERLRRR